MNLKRIFRKAVRKIGENINLVLPLPWRYQLATHGGLKAVVAPFPKWPLITKKQKEKILEALKKIESGVNPVNFVADFEIKFSQYVGKKYSLSCNSGTSALFFAILGCGIKPGDEVIVPTYTWGAAVACVFQNKGVPVLVDIEPETFTIDPAKIEQAITKKTKAIIVVHLFGLPADLDPILQIAKRHNLIVIEDCAQAHGARYKGKKVGSIGDISIFSFQTYKNLPGFEGGIVLTDDKKIYKRMIVNIVHPARQQLKIPLKKKSTSFDDSTVYSPRMHPLGAVMASSYLGELDRYNKQRGENIELLIEKIKSLPGIKFFPRPKDRTHAYHMLAWYYDKKELNNLPKEKFIKFLSAEGVPIFSYLKTPLHLLLRHKKERSQYRSHRCTFAEKYCRDSELMIITSGFVGHKKRLVEQIAFAFEKITLWFKSK